MLTLAEARRLAQHHAQARGAEWFDDGVLDRGTYWFLRVGDIGSSGVVVDKADGRLSVMGSALPLDDALWGHERGFSPEFVRLRVRGVHDEPQAVESLLRFAPQRRNPNPGRAWVRERLQSLPCEFGPARLWLSIPHFRVVEREGWFEFDIVEAQAPFDTVGDVMGLETPRGDPRGDPR